MTTPSREPGRRIMLYAHPEVDAALDKLALGLGLTRSAMFARLVRRGLRQYERGLKPRKTCRNCGSSPCRPTCVVSYPVQEPRS